MPASQVVALPHYAATLAPQLFFNMGLSSLTAERITDGALSFICLLLVWLVSAAFPHVLLLRSKIILSHMYKNLITVLVFKKRQSLDFKGCIHQLLLLYQNS